jgi:hypothetical protein
MPRTQRNYETMILDPTYKAVWDKAIAEAPLTIPLKTKSAAIRLRYKLYETRKILIAQDSSYSHLLGFSIQVTDSKLIIDTADLSIKESLEKIGIGATQIPNLEDL